MSKFRCVVDVSFDSEDNAIAFLNLIQEVKDRVFKGTGKEEISIIAKCEYHECFHDEDPPRQCGGYINYDLSETGKEDIKNKAGQKIDAGDLLK